jgi:hypothetical protein
VQAVDREYLMTELKEVLGSHPKKWRATFIQNLRKAFREEHSDGVVSVVGQLLQIPGEQDSCDILSMMVFTTVDDFLVSITSLA